VNQLKSRATAFILLLLGATFPVFAADDHPAPPDSDPAAVALIARDLAPHANVQSIGVTFLCEKRLLNLDTPLQSSGHWWVERERPNDDSIPDVTIRFSTESPYLSDLILIKHRAYSISQHEKKWTGSGQSSHPGLTAVMLDLSDLLAGHADHLHDLFTVSAAPAAPLPAPAGKSAPLATPADVFILTPVNKDLSAAVSSVAIALARPGQNATSSPPLIFAEITTAQGDITRYWFSHAQVDSPLPTDIFKPVERKAPPATSP